MKTIHEKLIQRLAEMEAEQNRLEELLAMLHGLNTQVYEPYFPQHKGKKPDFLKSGKKTDNSYTITKSRTSANMTGYVVCLMLNPKSPPEWSGKEWHVHGKGKCYSNIEQAHQCLQQLQKRWPNYTFQVLER